MLLFYTLLYMFDMLLFYTLLYMFDMLLYYTLLYMLSRCAAVSRTDRCSLVVLLFHTHTSVYFLAVLSSVYALDVLQIHACLDNSLHFSCATVSSLFPSYTAILDTLSSYQSTEGFTIPVCPSLVCFLLF